MKRHLLTNGSLPFPQDRKTLTFYLHEQGDDTRRVVIMWSSPSRWLKTEPMCVGSGVADPHLTPPAQTFRGSCLVCTVGTASLPQGSQVPENVWGLTNRTAAALTTRVCNHWPVPRLHSTRGQWAELQCQLRHPP